MYVDNDRSASRFALKDRPEWQRLKAEIRSGDTLVAWEASRTTRDLAEHAVLRDLCIERDVRLAYGGKVLDFATGDDRFIGGLDVLLAERESEMISSRVRRGMKAAVAAGRPHGAPPWGYRRGMDGWELDPVEAPRLREAARRLLDGESLRSVTRWLNDQGSTCSLTKVRRTLSSPTLAALRIYHGTVAGQGNWPALWSPEQHEQLARRCARDAGGPGPKPKHLLSGIATCGVCRKPLRARGIHQRYECFDGCVSRSAPRMEAEALNQLLKAVESVTPPADVQHDDGPLAELQAAEDELELLLDAADRGEVAVATLIKLEPGMRARIEDLRKRIPAPVSAIPDVEDLRAAWPQLSIDDQRAIVRTFLDITVEPIGPGSRELGVTITEKGVQK